MMTFTGVEESGGGQGPGASTAIALPVIIPFKAGVPRPPLHGGAGWAGIREGVRKARRCGTMMDRRYHRDVMDGRNHWRVRGARNHRRMVSDRGWVFCHDFLSSGDGGRDLHQRRARPERPCRFPARLILGCP